MRAARPVTVVLLAASAVALAACSSGSDGAAPTPTATVTVTETATVTSTPSASLTPSSTPTPTATTTSPAGARCTSRQLNVKIRALDSGAGQRYGAIVLTNSSSSTCAVTGYPGMQLIGSTGKAVPTTVVRVSSPAPRTVTLAPNAQAASAISWGVVATGSEPNTGPCEPIATTARVTPPDATVSISTPWNLGPVCNKGRVSAKAFVAGNGG